MGREFYAASDTAVARRLYAGLKEAARSLGRVSVLGGWAVYELVEPVAAMESLDVDVLVHEDAAWVPTVSHISRQGFVWRRLGRSRDRRLVLRGREHDEEAPAVDVFYTRGVDGDRLQRLFGREWTANLKELPYTGFVPPLEAVVADKLATLPLRPAHDPRLKRVKDALDLHALLFHHRAGRRPEDILRHVADPRPAVEVLCALEVGPFGPEVQAVRGALERALRP